MAPYLGGKAAYAALGDPRAETAYRNTHLKTHLAHRFATPHFLRVANFWYKHWVDPREMRLSR